MLDSNQPGVSKVSGRVAIWIEYLRERPILGIGIVASVMVLVVAVVMAMRDDAADTALTGEGGEAAQPAYPRGPNGGRLLSDSTLQLEVTIYEADVPPHFRVYPFDAKMSAVAPRDVNLRIELHRLGGRVDTITFVPEAAYLRGEQVVEEPHSFDVKVFATRGGRNHQWAYSQIEGKVRLDDQQLASAGITIETAGPRQIATTFELNGQVKSDETRLAHVVPRVKGVITQVLKQEGDAVRSGELLAVMNSRELADAKSAYLAAEQYVEFTKNALNREEALWKRKISAEREYLEAKRQFDEAALALRLAGETLISLGLRGSELTRISASPGTSLSRYEIRAPLSGRVIERNVAVGEAVSGEDDIFTVADLSTVWVDIAVPAKDLGLVRPGQQVTVRSADLEIETSGRISYVGPLVGQETRSAPARVVLPNRQGQWRAGLFVTVTLVRDVANVPLVVATEGIQRFRDWQVVFVRYGDSFEARPLELGRRDGEWIEVLSGLKPGERYAAKNSFAVKAEIGKLGATHDH